MFIIYFSVFTFTFYSTSLCKVYQCVVLIKTFICIVTYLPKNSRFVNIRSFYCCTQRFRRSKSFLFTENNILRNLNFSTQCGWYLQMRTYFYSFQTCTSSLHKMFILCWYIMYYIFLFILINYFHWISTSENSGKFLNSQFFLNIFCLRCILCKRKVRVLN